MNTLKSVIDRLIKEQDRRVRHAEFVSEIRIQMQSQEKIITDKKPRVDLLPIDTVEDRTTCRWTLSQPCLISTRKRKRIEDEEEITTASLPRAVKRYVILDAKLENVVIRVDRTRCVMYSSRPSSFASAPETVQAKITSQRNNRNVSLMKVSSVESTIPDNPLAFAVCL